MTIPCDEMQKRGIVADYAHLNAVQKYAKQSMRDGEAGPGAYDIYVIPRGAFVESEALGLLKAAGKKLVFEVDDDFTNRHRTVIGDPAIYDAIWGFVRNTCDAVLVSTEPLAEVMRRETDLPVYIAHNAVRYEQWQVKKQPRVTIGLTGSITHEADWSVLKDVLPEVLAGWPDVQLLLSGYVPPYFQDLHVSFPRQVVSYEPRPYDYYPAVAGSAHVVLCPVDPTDEFNRSKSGVKAIEGMAAGAAVIATDFDIYRAVLDEKVGYLVPHTPKAWRDAIEDALTGRTWETLGQTAKRRARRNHSIDQTWHEWRRAFKSIAGY